MQRVIKRNYRRPDPKLVPEFLIEMSDKTPNFTRRVARAVHVIGEVVKVSSKSGRTLHVSVIKDDGSGFTQVTRDGHVIIDVSWKIEPLVPLWSGGGQ